MLIRLASHYPNSGHTAETLKVVSEDWFHTFNGKITDRAFIDALTSARRKGKGFFPTESDIFEIIGLNPDIDCKKCGYYNGGNCKNIINPEFNQSTCKSFQVKSRWK